MSEMLVEAAKTGGVKTLAIVDDAYDPPASGEISENAFNQFVQALEASPQLLAALAAVSPLQDSDLDDWEEFTTTEGLINTLWLLYVGGAASAQVDVTAQTALANLFQDIQADRISKLQQLKPLEDLLGQIGGTLWKLGAASEPETVAKADVVFLDLYLSTDVPPVPFNGKISRNALDRARERAITYLQAVRSVTQEDLDATAPAFILISSLGTDLVGQNFRRKARQTASRFRFVSKQAIAGSEPHGLLAIADIFRTCAACAVIEPFQKAWPKVLKEAQEWVADKLLELDISDFGRLYHQRLRAEGQPVEDYVKELIAGALTEQVSRAFSQHRPSTLTDNPFEKTPSFFFEAPSNAFADLYNATRITQDPGYRGVGGMDPLSGDIYLVGPSPTSTQKSLSGREVAAVMSPICDLLDRNDKKSPAAESTLLLRGILRPATFKHDGEPQTVSVSGSFYEIEWNMKNPGGISLSVLKAHRAANEWAWLGRLKSEHFLALQSNYLQSLGRVGLMKSPGLFEPLAGQIYVREAGALTKLGKHFTVGQQFAYLSPDQKQEPEKQPVFFSGNFIEHLSKLMGEVEIDAGRAEVTKAKAKGLLERTNALLELIKSRRATQHTVQNYLNVHLLEAKGSQIPACADGIIIIGLWKA